MKLSKLLLLLFLSISKNIYSMSFQNIVKPISIFLPFDYLSKSCEKINYLSDNFIMLGQPKEICEINDESQSELTCLQYIESDEILTKKIVFWYSKRNIISLSNSLKQSKNNLANNFILKLKCYSSSLLSNITDENLLDLDYFLIPMIKLFSLNSNIFNDNEISEVWRVHFEKIALKNSWDYLLKIKEDQIRIYAYLHYINDTIFNSLLENDKFEFSKDILNLFSKYHLDLNSNLISIIKNYFEKRPLEWEFPLTEFIKFGNIFNSTLIRFLESYIEKDYENSLKAYTDSSYYDLLKNNLVPNKLKCQIINLFVQKIKKNIIYSDQTNDFLNTLIQNNFACDNKLNQTILSLKTNTDEFKSTWCPKHVNCILFFKNEKWKNKYAYCKADSDCVSLRSNNCERLYFNKSVEKNDLKLYNEYCNNRLDNSEVDFRTKEIQCLDNYCQEATND